MNQEKAETLSNFLPSSNLQVLRSLIGAEIKALIRYSWWPTFAVVDRLGISSEMVFSLTLGQVLMHLADGRVIGIGDIPPLKSVTVWMQRDNNNAGTYVENSGDKTPISASDTEFASEAMRAVLGKRIDRVRILKRLGQSAWWRTRPAEVGLMFECEGHSILFSHGLNDDMDTFSVITPDQILDTIRPELRELNTLPE